MAFFFLRLPFPTRELFKTGKCPLPADRYFPVSLAMSPIASSCFYNSSLQEQGTSPLVPRMLLLDLVEKHPQEIVIKMAKDYFFGTS